MFLSSIVLTVITLIVSIESIAQEDRPADYVRDQVANSYHIELLTGPMEKEPKPMTITLLMLKKVNDYHGVGDGIDLSPSFQLKANTNYQFDFESEMAWSEIDYLHIEWQDLAEVYGKVDDINFETATITRKILPIFSSTKKFCAEKAPRNFVGSIAGSTFYPC